MNNLSTLEKTLQSLVAIRSVGDDTKAAQDVISFVKYALRDFPLYVQEFHDEGYPILLMTTRQTLSPQTLLLAHADVLPAHNELFNLRFDRHALYGRGVWDMKFAIAGYIELIKSIGDRLHEYDFGILITSDEETRNKNVPFALKKQIRPKNVVLLDGSSDWQIESSAKGAWTINITASGTTAHGSRPWEGESASFLLLDTLRSIRQWFPEGRSLKNKTLNISLIMAGQAANQLPETATACLDMRFASNEERDDISKKIVKITQNKLLSWETVVDIPALTHDIKNHYFSIFTDCTTRIAGVHQVSAMSYGASDAAHFIQAGIPCIVTRPTGGGHHSNDEWINRKSLAQMVPILTNYLDNLTS